MHCFVGTPYFEQTQMLTWWVSSLLSQPYGIGKRGVVEDYLDDNASNT